MRLSKARRAVAEPAFSMPDQTSAAPTPRRDLKSRPRAYAPDVASQVRMLIAALIGNVRGKPGVRRRGHPARGQDEEGRPTMEPPLCQPEPGRTKRMVGVWKPDLLDSAGDRLPVDGRRHRKKVAVKVASKKCDKGEACSPEYSAWR